MTVAELKQGDTFYEVTHSGIRKIEYLMMYPFKNPKNRVPESYHIIIDRSLEQPQRVYYKFLETLLEQNIRTYSDALVKRVQLTDELAKYYRDRLTEESNL